MNHTDTPSRGRLKREAFKRHVDEMRKQGVLNDVKLEGFVCEGCFVENPFGYEVASDYRVSREQQFAAALIIGVVGIVIGILLTPILIGIPILIGAVIGSVYYMFKKGDVMVHKGERACAACFHSVVDMETTRGKALLQQRQRYS